MVFYECGPSRAWGHDEEGSGRHDHVEDEEDDEEEEDDDNDEEEGEEEEEEDEDDDGRFMAHYHTTSS